MAKEREFSSPESIVEHKMRQIRISKVAVNICVGKSGEPLERAKKILTEITKRNPCSRNAKTTIKDWGIREGEPISCLVTLRGHEAESFVRNALEALSNKIRETCFDDKGTFGFGMKEQIEIPGTRYVPELGIVGMNINVALERPGYRVKRRVFRHASVGARHQITRSEAIQFARQTFPIEIIRGETVGETESA